MANARRDENRKVTMTALLNTDGTTIKNIRANPSTHALGVINGTTGSDLGNHIQIDENRIPVLFAVSSVDGSSLIALYADSNGALLVDNM